MQPLSIIPNANQQVLVVCRPGWIQAWRCKCWMSIYSSVLVKETSEFYRPVAEVILTAEHVDVVHRELVDDPDMMFGQAKLTVMKLRR